jgi:hypothetical protein
MPCVIPLIIPTPFSIPLTRHKVRCKMHDTGCRTGPYPCILNQNQEAHEEKDTKTEAIDLLYKRAK